MKLIRYTNIEGHSVELSVKRPFFLVELEGFGPVQNELQSSKLYGTDGAILVDSKLTVRDMTIEGEIVANSSSELAEYRQTLSDVFNPKISGTLFYEEYDKKFSIDVEVEHGPNFDMENSNITQKFQLILKALDPYWRDTSIYDSLIPLSKVENKFSFPLIISDEFVFASMISGEIISVNNNGSVDVGGVITIKIKGEVTNPRIYNVLTQEYFGFDGTYQNGTTFRISTLRGKKKVEKTIEGITANAMSERMLGSAFLQLKKGENYLQLQADNDVNLVIGELNFTPLVMGV